MRRGAVWLLVLVGVGLIAAPLVFNMWVRAPKGAEMIGDFKPYMTHERAALYNDNYLPAISLGFGNVPQAVSDAADRYGNGATMDYSQAVTFLESHPQLGQLSYVQKNFPTMAAPFTNMVSVMVRDVDDFNGVAGLPPFWLFPFFFTIPGLILVAAGIVLLRRERAGTTAGRAPQWIALVLGLGLAAAPFLPMPPGWVLMWNVAPHGAHMIDDFASPATGVPGTAGIMTHDTVTLFNGYLSSLQAGRREIIPAIQAVAAQYRHPISAAEAAAFVKGDPKLASVNTILDGFPAMYDSFHGMLTVMDKDIGDYEAVKALPPFTMFPYFFILPGIIIALAAGAVLATDAGAARRREDEGTGIGMSGNRVATKAVGSEPWV